jgi:hypothetical protein
MNPSSLTPESLPQDLHHKLSELAAARGCDLHQAIEMVIAEGLARLESMTPDERSSALQSAASAGG